MFGIINPMHIAQRFEQLHLGTETLLGESTRPGTEKVPRILQKFGGSKLRRLAAQLRHFCSDVRPFISKLEAQLCPCAPFETTDQGDCYRELRRITLLFLQGTSPYWALTKSACVETCEPSSYTRYRPASEDAVGRSDVPCRPPLCR